MKKNGFSLLELSIVLVIIGLIAGGIVAGSSMIRAAEIRAIITQQEQILVSAYTFKEKYLGMPGDLTNAYRFWSTDARCAADQVVTSADDTGCNGDGDGLIDHWVGEHFTAWMHLSLAGLINGNYTGSFADRYDYQIGENIPESKISGGAWLFYDSAPDNQNYTSGSKFSSEKNSLMINPPITNTQENYTIDKKLDDGKPGLGKVTSHTYCNISDNQDTDSAEYDLMNTTQLCNIRFSP